MNINKILRSLLRNSKIKIKQFKIQIKKFLINKIHKQIKKKNQINSRMSFNKIKTKSLRLNTKIIIIKKNNNIKLLRIYLNKT